MLPCVLRLLLLHCITGCHAVRWSMSVPALVNGTKGQNALLPCSFTHPDQQFFRGEILVKWITGSFYGHTIFQCSVMNSTEGKREQCLDTKSPKRYALQGNPRERNLSLLIQGLMLSDIKQYYCRVELDHKKSAMYQDGRGTSLKISARPEILNLSLVTGPSPSDDSLECVAEGNPRPTMTYHSPAGLEITGFISVPSEANPFRVTIRIPITSPDPHVCRATNQLGTVERVFPLHQEPSGLTLALCICGALLLLGLVLVLLWFKYKGTAPSCSLGYRHKHTREDQCQPPEGGDTGIIYADINVSITNDPVLSMTKDRDTDVCYAEVKFS